MTQPAHILKPRAIAAYVVKKEAEIWKYLLLRRCSSFLTHTWQMVSGGLENGEKAWQGALREIFEETGLKPTQLYSVDLCETFYLIRDDVIMINPVFVAFVDNKQQVTLSPNEHDAHIWATYEEAVQKLIFTQQKNLLDHIRTHFLEKEPNPWLHIKF